MQASERVLIAAVVVFCVVIIAWAPWLANLIGGWMR